MPRTSLAPQDLFWVMDYKQYLGTVPASQTGGSCRTVNNAKYQMQLVQGKKHPSRYKSGIWSSVEKNHDATKRECRGVLKALKKIRYWLYGVRFILETDASVLVAQLNRSGTDLPRALVIQWIAWIQLFDFEVWHIFGQKHSVADGLSRRPLTIANLAEAKAEEDIDDFIQAKLNSLRVSPI